MRLKLTSESVAELPVDGKDRLYFDTLQPGFGVRVTPSGAKIFVAQARIDGRPRRLPVGRHPDLKVAAARAEARTMLADMRQGVDPRAAREQRRIDLKTNTTTVAELADRWLAEHVRLKRKPRTIADYEKIVETKIKPWAGQRSVASIKRSDVLELHTAMAKTPRRANYVAAVIRAMFSFAERVGLREQNDNPAKGIEHYREVPRERYLNTAELELAAELIGSAEREGRIGPHIAAGLRLCLFTGCRSGEATALEWSNVDLDAKVARLADSKSNRPRVIHLNGPAVATLKGLPRVGRFVVAGRKPNQPAKNLGQAWVLIRKKTVLEDVRLHDLRHSFASAAVSKGLSLPLIGKLLGHTVPATTARYAHLHQDAVAAANNVVGAVYEAAVKPKQKR